jgi:hypothetical protein
MPEVSERAKIAIEIAPPDVVAGTSDTWVSRITDTVRMVYFLRPDGIVVDDVIDRRRYGG